MSCRVATFASTQKTLVSKVLRDMSRNVQNLRQNSVVSGRAQPERVFSLLEAMFGKGHDSALADLIQAALMLRYNGRTLG